MSIDTSKLTIAELEALMTQVKTQLKQGITPADPAIKAVVEQIRAIAKDQKIEVSKVLAAVNSNFKESKPRKISERVELQRQLKAAGIKTTPQTSTDELKKLAAKL